MHCLYLLSCYSGRVVVENIPSAKPKILNIGPLQNKFVDSCQYISHYYLVIKNNLMQLHRRPMSKKSLNIRKCVYMYVCVYIYVYVYIFKYEYIKCVQAFLSVGAIHINILSCYHDIKMKLFKRTSHSIQLVSLSTHNFFDTGMAFYSIALGENKYIYLRISLKVQITSKLYFNMLVDIYTSLYFTFKSWRHSLDFVYHSIYINMTHIPIF